MAESFFCTDLAFFQLAEGLMIVARSRGLCRICEPPVFARILAPPAWSTAAGRPRVRAAPGWHPLTLLAGRDLADPQRAGQTGTKLAVFGSGE
jgi:hypothetical protein